MAVLAYRPDWEEARDRLTRWWNGENFGRAALQITVPRPHPAEHVEPAPIPAGVVCERYTAQDLDLRVNLARRGCINTYYLGEAVPYHAPGDLGPGTLSLFLGCHGTEMPTTVWFEPCIADADEIVPEYDADNPYWMFCQEAHRGTLPFSRGRFLQQFPDLIEGLDTLAALRGTEELLMDLLDRPEWVHRCLHHITQVYFRHYDMLYDLIRDEVGGSVFWCWAPGRLVKLQCDVSFNISPRMFRDFMVPVLQEMTERTSYSLYHWDGPGALCHQDALLSLPHLDMLQWTPGAGEEPTCHRRYWPMYHDAIEAGKRVMIYAENAEGLPALKREFGEKTQSFMINIPLPTLAQADECIRLMELG